MSDKFKEMMNGILTKIDNRYHAKGRDAEEKAALAKLYVIYTNLFDTGDFSKIGEDDLRRICFRHEESWKDRSYAVGDGSELSMAMNLVRNLSDTAILKRFEELGVDTKSAEFRSFTGNGLSRR